MSLNVNIHPEGRLTGRVDKITATADKPFVTLKIEDEGKELVTIYADNVRQFKRMIDQVVRDINSVLEEEIDG